MNIKFVFPLAFLALASLMSCSDSKGEGSSTGVSLEDASADLPQLENSPDVAILESNNKTMATPQQKEEDLATLSQLDELGSSFKTVEGSLTMGIGYLAASERVNQQVSSIQNQILAKKNCQVMENTDFTDTIGNTIFHQKIQWLNSAGTPLETCEYEEGDDFLDVLNQMNGSSYVMNMTTKSDSVDSELNLLMRIALKYSMAGMTFGFSAAANQLIDVKLPKAFNAYMEMKINLPVTTIKNEQQAEASMPEPDYSLVFWFQNGRYKCEVENLELESNVDEEMDFSTAEMETEQPMKLCDLENASAIVGSLWTDGSVNLIVKDASGAVINK